MQTMCRLPRARALLSAGLVLVMTAGLAFADDDARMKQLRLLCAQLSGDLTDPGGIAAFRRCLTTKNPLNEIRRDNNIAAPAAAPNAEAPDGFGRNSRFHVADGIERFQVADADLVYVINSAGKLWRATIEGKDAHQLDEKVAGFQISDGHLFVHSADGTLWRKAASAKPEQVDQAVAAFQALDAQMVFVLGKNGRLWREIGGRAQAMLIDRDVLVSAGKAAFQAPDPGHVFVLGSDHKLWAESMP